MKFYKITVTSVSDKVNKVGCFSRKPSVYQAIRFVYNDLTVEQIKNIIINGSAIVKIFCID